MWVVKGHLTGWWWSTPRLLQLSLCRATACVSLMVSRACKQLLVYYWALQMLLLLTVPMCTMTTTQKISTYHYVAITDCDYVWSATASFQGHRYIPVSQENSNQTANVLVETRFIYGIWIMTVSQEELSTN